MAISPKLSNTRQNNLDGQNGITGSFCEELDFLILFPTNTDALGLQVWSAAIPKCLFLRSESQKSTFKICLFFVVFCCFFFILE